MKNNQTHLVFILDRSGSMGGLEKDTIGGYNSFIQKQKKEKGEAILTTVLFDDKYEVIHDAVDIKNIQSISENEYFVRGSTALFDAIGKSMDALSEKYLATLICRRPEKVLFVITTDGMENASKQYSREKIRGMIEHYKSKYSWEFLFLGANIDAVEVASSMGISQERAVQYACDAKGIKLNYEAVGNAVKCFRASREINEEWKQEIEEDFCSRTAK